MTHTTETPTLSEQLRAAQVRYEQAREDYHERIMLANQYGMSLRIIAEQLNVSHETIRRIIHNHKRDTGLA